MSIGVPTKLQKGFTITELLVAVAVGSIASILIVTAFVYTYGDVLTEQAKTQMIQQSQLFLSRMSGDIRVASEIRSVNQIADAYVAGGWTTSDPANILITTQPATDADGDLIFDSSTGYPYQHEVIYHGSGGEKMFRRLLTNSGATGHAQITTCPSGNPCRPDTELVEYLDNMLFEFYDVDDNITTVPEDARSIQVTVNLRRIVYGEEVTATNATRITLRNEN